MKSSQMWRVARDLARHPKAVISVGRDGNSVEMCVASNQACFASI
jgi:hypothetical protein